MRLCCNYIATPLGDDTATLGAREILSLDPTSPSLCTSFPSSILPQNPGPDYALPIAPFAGRIYIVVRCCARPARQHPPPPPQRACCFSSLRSLDHQYADPEAHFTVLLWLPTLHVWPVGHAHAHRGAGTTAGRAAHFRAIMSGCIRHSASAAFASPPSRHVDLAALFACCVFGADG